MENSKEMRNWLDAMNLDHPLVIAGPCSAETEEQVLKIAHELKDTDVNYFRAGIWKPRTKPGMFEGVGALGLNLDLLGFSPIQSYPFPLGRLQFLE